MKAINLAIGLLATLPFSGLQAQTMSLTAEVPFDFQVGDTVLPAGDYRIEHVDGILKLRSESGNEAAVVLTIAAVAPRDAKEAVLLFHRYGESYFLEKIWTPDSEIARQLPKSRTEHELARNGPAKEVATLVLATK